MSAPEDGGPAFPSRVDREFSHHLIPGMSLRDWFAGQSLAVLVAVSSEEDYKDLKSSVDRAARLARASYLVADAMLEERTKGHS